jgi:hypothetical protein
MRKLRAPANPVPRRLRDRSKYDPHQSIREQMRRVGQMLRGHHQTDQMGMPVELYCSGAKALYVDYSTAKAAGRDLTRFIGYALVPAMDEPKGLLDGVDGVQILPETGPSPA